jgi:hypothetical protein
MQSVSIITIPASVKLYLTQFAFRQVSKIYSDFTSPLLYSKIYSDFTSPLLYSKIYSDFPLHYIHHSDLSKGKLYQVQLDRGRDRDNRY